MHSAKEKSLELEALPVRDLTGRPQADHAGQAWIMHAGEPLASGDARYGVWGTVTKENATVVGSYLLELSPRSNSCTASEARDSGR